MNNLLKTILVRAYADLSNPGYHSIIHRDSCITLLPIVEKHNLKTIPSFIDPSKLIDKCIGKPMVIYYKFSKIKPLAIHNDPRIDLGLYTEEAKPSRLPFSKISKETILLFMSSLAMYPEHAWFVDNREFRSILKNIRIKNKVGIYIIGGIVVNKVLKINNSIWDMIIEEYPVLIYSPHYYRLNNRDTIAYIGKGFYVNPPLKIATLSASGFRVTPELRELVGSGNIFKLIKQNFRKTSIVNVEHGVYEKILGSRIDYV